MAYIVPGQQTASRWLPTGPGRDPNETTRMIHTDPSAHGDEFPPPFKLGSWLVQADLNRVSGPDGDHRVEPRVMRVLLCLARRPNEVWTRQALLDAVWGDTVVGEEILTRAISELRRIFGDKARDPRFIETIRHHGYRLITAPEPVEVERPVPPRSAPEPAPEPPLEPAPSGPVTVPPPILDPGGSRPVDGRGRPMVWAALAILILVVGLILGPRLFPGERPGSSDGPVPADAVPLTSFPGREWDPRPLARRHPRGLRLDGTG